MEQQISKCPASIIQEQFWLTNSLQPDSSAYNIPSLFSIKGDLNISALEQSICTLVQRHQAFRTTFVTENGKPVQVIRRSIQFHLDYVDCHAQFHGQDDAEVRRKIQTAIDQPFNLLEGPLIRCRLYALAQNEYLLLIVMHHIITDLHAKEMMASELADLYRVYRAGSHPDSVKDLPPHQYTDYCRWHRDWLTGEEYPQMLGAWKQHLDGRPDYLNLPADMPRPAWQSFHGDSHFFQFSTDAVEGLKKIAKIENLNIFLILLTSYLVLLYRYSGQKDITIGVPFTNRRQAAHKDILGCFVNILPLAFDLSADPSFNDLLRQVREVMLLAHRRQEVPYELIVKALQPKREPSFNPLFQVGFTFEPPMQLSLEGLQVESKRVNSSDCRLDLFPILWEEGEDVAGIIEYCTDLFEKMSIKRFVSHWEVLLKALPTMAGEPVSSLPLLAPEEREQILVDWNSTDKNYAGDCCLSRLFEAQVAKTPQAAAVVYGGASLSYLELNQRANRLAHHLRKLGVGSETVVGIFMERSLEMIVAIYGILKAGGAYVPLDPEYPAERTAFMLEDTKVPVILTQEYLASRVPENHARTISLDVMGPELALESSDNLSWAPRADHLAYVIYTSGSTGRPKGVMNEHRGIVNRLTWMQETFGLGGDDTVLQKTPFSFDVSVWEFFWPLLVGARLAVAPPRSHRDPAALIRLINEHNVTTIHFVPSMLQAFLETANLNNSQGLRRVICSGEAMSYDLQETFFDRMDSELYNLYGPTEAAVDVTFWKCRPGDKRRVVPIGRPVANTQIYIVDQHMQSVPIGGPGELLIGGVQVARGYLNREELTDEKFIADIFGDKNGARLYKTGDLARFLADGSIEYLGRLDHQVKLHGLRIELGEIEAVLTAHPKVQQAAVVTKNHESGGKRIVAYLVPDSVQAHTVRQVLAFDREKSREAWQPYSLPNGMIVSHLNRNETDFMFREIFQDNFYLRHGITIPDRACIFDVGANIGLFSIFAGMTNNATVYSFEPIPPVFKILSTNAALYDLNIKPFNLGLADRLGLETFTYYPKVSILSGRNAVLAKAKERTLSHLENRHSVEGALDSFSPDVVNELLEDRLQHQKYDCRLSTLSTVIREQGVAHIDLLKIDVEGSEIDVLHGIRQDDWPKIKQLTIEVHDGQKGVDEIRTLLKEHGYEVSVAEDSTLEGADLHQLYAVQPSYRNKTPIPGTSKQTENTCFTPAQLQQDVKKILAKKLPDYMLPAAMVCLEKLPLTSSGKVDRQGLPEPENFQSGVDNKIIPPASKMEKLLLGIWQEILQHDHIGIHDNFFDVGGDSLLGIFFISEVEKTLRQEVPIVKLFQYPTIHSFAEYLHQKTAAQPLLPGSQVRKRAQKQRMALAGRRKKAKD